MPPKTEFESFDCRAGIIPREFPLSFSFWVNATELDSRLLLVELASSQTLRIPNTLWWQLLSPRNCLREVYHFHSVDNLFKYYYLNPLKLLMGANSTTLCWLLTILRHSTRSEFVVHHFSR